MANEKTYAKKKCKNTHKCGYNAESGYDKCCNCLAQEAGIAHAAMRKVIEDKKLNPYAFPSGGWGDNLY